jgi:hypothetical protein
MTVLLFWVLIGAVATPFVLLTVGYRRVIDQKIHEVEGRFAAYPKHLYTLAYGTDVRKSLGALYHPNCYIPPVAILVLTTSAFAAAAMIYLDASLGLPVAFEARVRRIPQLALVGAGGAYIWGLVDLLRRFRTADLSPATLHACWLRILTAAAIGPLLGMALSPPVDVWTAFAVGALPFQDMWEVIRSRVSLPSAAFDAQPPTLQLLEGATPGLIQRLRDEEIDSVQRLAFANPLSLLFRTNLEWNVILDLIDQAMLVNFVGVDIAKLRPLGARGAIELAQLHWAMCEGDAGERENAAAVLKLIAEELGIPESAAMNLAYQLKLDAMVRFIWTHWNASAPALSSPLGTPFPTPIGIPLPESS